MIYVCIPAYNEAPTVGLLLWQVRQALRAFPREYHLLVADDASDDATFDVIDSYARVLPLTLVRHAEQRGYAASLEELLSLALQRTDRPKRDCLVTMHADFSHDPRALPDLVRRVESGADLVVAEDRGAHSAVPLAERLLRRAGPWALAGAVGIEGVRDVISGFFAVRLSVLKRALERRDRGRVLALDGWAANAELLRRARVHSRRTDIVRVATRHQLRQRGLRCPPIARFRSLLSARLTVRRIAA